jgi:hypothetical protein
MGVDSLIPFHFSRGVTSLTEDNLWTGVLETCEPGRARFSGREARHAECGVDRRMTLRQNKNERRHRAGLSDSASTRPADAMRPPRHAVTGPVVPQSILAFVRAIGGHQVRQHRDTNEKMGSRRERLEAGLATVTIALQVDFLEVKRPMSEASRCPAETLVGPAASHGRRLRADWRSTFRGVIPGQLSAGQSDVSS